MIGLALGGGGARGYAHIGILKVFEKENIPIGCLAGTSFGGIIAACYALGYTSQELENVALKLSDLRELIKLLDPSPLRRGFLEGERVHKYLRSLIGENTTFADLKIPLRVNAVNILNGQEVVLSSGNVVDAVMATCSFPGLFPPAKVNDMLLVDGGVLNNVPVSLLYEMGAQIKIGIDVQVDPIVDDTWIDVSNKPQWPLSFPEYLIDFYRTELIMVAHLTRENYQKFPADILLRPNLPPEVSMFLGFPKAVEGIRAGEIEAKQYLSSIYTMLNLPKT